jgi:hypothetical protein
MSMQANGGSTTGGGGDPSSDGNDLTTDQTPAAEGVTDPTADDKRNQAITDAFISGDMGSITSALDPTHIPGN